MGPLKWKGSTGLVPLDQTDWSTSNQRTSMWTGVCSEGSNYVKAFKSRLRHLSVMMTRSLVCLKNGWPIEHTHVILYSALTCMWDN